MVHSQHLQQALLWRDLSSSPGVQVGSQSSELHGCSTPHPNHRRLLRARLRCLNQRVFERLVLVETLRMVARLDRSNLQLPAGKKSGSGPMSLQQALGKSRDLREIQPGHNRRQLLENHSHRHIQTIDQHRLSRPRRSQKASNTHIGTAPTRKSHSRNTKMWAGNLLEKLHAQSIPSHEQAL